MQAQDGTAPQIPVSPAPAGEPLLTLEAVEIELSLDGFKGGTEHFDAAVREAARAVNGDFLFSLPASGLAEDCLAISALHVPDGADGMKLMFACLSEDASAIRIEEPNDGTADLARFAGAFVDVLQRM